MRPRLYLVAAMVVCGSSACGVAPDGVSLLPDAPSGPVVRPDAGDDGDGGMIEPEEPSDLATLCGGTEPAADADWERCFRRRKCEWKVGCEADSQFTDLQQCLDLNDAVSGGQLGFDERERARAFAAERASINVPVFTQCLKDLGPHHCLTALRSVACETRYTGTIADHQACYADAECKSAGAHCDPQACGAACCLGSCTPRLKLGEACSTYLGCAPGLMCGSSGRCVSGDSGSACVDVRDCDANNWCDRQAKICKPSVTDGARCADILQCANETTCVGLRYNVAPARCLRVTVEGDACDQDCFGGLRCDLSVLTNGLGQCRPLPRHGEGCGLFLPCTGANDVCSTDLGLCITRPAAGEACADGACGPGLFCDESTPDLPTCTRPLVDGQSGCAQPNECQSHICSGTQDATGQCQPWRDTCP